MMGSIATPITDQTESMRYPHFASAPTVDNSERTYVIRVPRLPAIEISTSGELPNWLDNVVSTILRFQGLTANWDSYGAAPIHDRALLRTLLFVLTNTLLGAPHLTPTRRGGVQVEWSSGKADLEVEITGSGIVGGYFENRQDRSEHELSPEDFTSLSINSKFAEFFG